jgi:hypothetical protein
VISYVEVVEVLFDLITSLRHEISFEFSKKMCSFRYMPDRSEEEILKCRAELYKHLSEDLMKALYLKWGGIALYVLKSAENEDQRLLRAALDGANLKSLVQAYENI